MAEGEEAGAGRAPAGGGMHQPGLTSVTQTTASPDLHTFPLPHCSRWMRPLQCRNEEERKPISQSPAAHEPSVLGMAASTARVAGSPACRAVPCRDVLHCPTLGHVHQPWHGAWQEKAARGHGQFLAEIPANSRGGTAGVASCCHLRASARPWVSALFILSVDEKTTAHHLAEAEQGWVLGDGSCRVPARGSVRTAPPRQAAQGTGSPLLSLQH